MLTVDGLTKSFGGVTAVSGVGFTVEKGTIQAVIGQMIQRGTHGRA